MSTATTAIMPSTISLGGALPDLPARLRQVAKPAIAAGCALGLIWGVADGLGFEARVALSVTALAVVGWTLTRLPEAIVALGAASTLALTGALSEERLFSALGGELIWLLMAAFLIAAVLKESGLVERLIGPLLKSGPSFTKLSIALTAAIGATAFVLPSTSGRAALLMPVFLAVAALLPDKRLIKPLALIFPTVILLSAGGSLIGAGAHLIAVDTISSVSGLRISYMDWAMIGGPLAAIASFAATVLILKIFAPRPLRALRLSRSDPPAPMTRRQWRTLGVLAVMVALFMTEGVHGIGMAMVALVGALMLLTPLFTDRRVKDIFRDVDLELLVYMSATILMAEAIMQTGADKWLADQAMGVLPPALTLSFPLVAVFLTVVAVLAHLVITSRSGRAAVLVPAMALPLAGFGHDVALMVLIAVMGTGFCQTMMSSAKPVAIYGRAEGETFDQRDLFRLAIPLGAMMVTLVLAFALFVWPSQVDRLRQTDSFVTTTPSIAAPAFAAEQPDKPPLISSAEPAAEPTGAVPAGTELAELPPYPPLPRPRPESAGPRIDPTLAALAGAAALAKAAQPTTQQASERNVAPGPKTRRAGARKAGQRGTQRPRTRNVRQAFTRDFGEARRAARKSFGRLFR